MALYLGILIFSFIVTSLVIVPYINLLYRLQVTHHHPIPPLTAQESREFKVWHRQHKWKIGTPIGGGVLIIVSTVLLYLFLFPFLSASGIYVTTVFPLKEEINILFFTFIAFALLGLHDDLVKIFNISRPSNKTGFILLLSLLVALMLYLNMDIQIINIPYWGVINLGWWYVPSAALIIAPFF